MTVLNPPIAVQARADHAADDLRGALMAGMAALGAVTVVRPRPGVLPGWGGELAVSQRAAGANMSVDVAAGAVLLQAPTEGHGGWYLLNDAVLNLAIAAAHATLPRIDLVIARVGDAQYYAGGDGAAAIEVITGTAAASPVAPTVPVAKGSYIVLGQIAVAAAASSIVNANITLNTSASIARTVAAGGVLPVANAAARTALTPHHGLHVIEADTGHEYISDRGTWRRLRSGSDIEPQTGSALPNQVVTTSTIGGPMSSNAGGRAGWYAVVNGVCHGSFRFQPDTAYAAGNINFRVPVGILAAVQAQTVHVGRFRYQNAAGTVYKSGDIYSPAGYGSVDMFPREDGATIQLNLAVAINDLFTWDFHYPVV